MRRVGEIGADFGRYNDDERELAGRPRGAISSFYIRILPRLVIITLSPFGQKLSIKHGHNAHAYGL